MLESSELMVQNAPALSQVAAVIGDVQIRNRNPFLVGSLSNAYPQGDYPWCLPYI